MKSTLHIAKTLSFLMALILLLGALFLPTICNQFILPRLTEQLPFSQKDIRISTISPWRLTGALMVAHDSQPVATIPRFELHYSPASLMHLEFERLLLDAAYIHLAATESGISLAELPQEKVEEKATTPLLPIELPFSIHSITVRQGRIRLHSATTEYNFDLESQIDMKFSKGTEKKYALASFSTSLATAGNLHLEAKLDGTFKADGLFVTTDLNLSSLEDIAAVAGIEQKPTLSGAMAAQARIGLTLGLELASLDLTAEADNFYGKYGDVAFIGTNADKGLQLNLNGDQNLLKFNLSHLGLAVPEEIDIDLSGSYVLSDKSFEAVASLFVRNLAHPLTARLSGTNNSDGIIADIALQSRPLQAKEFSLGKLDAAGKVNLNDGQVNGNITGTLGSVKVSGSELVLDDINWSIPFQLPVTKKEKGALNIESIRYKNKNLANLEADLTLGETDLAYTARFMGSGNIEGEITCAGSAFFTGSTAASCRMETTSIDSSTLRDFVSLPKDLNFTLDLNAEAALGYDLAGPTAQVLAHIKNGEITSGETTLSGITTDLTFPTLPTLHSGPGQLLTVDDIRSGQIHLTKGRIFYSIENENTIFLERVIFNWCGGKIEAASLRLKREMKEVDTTFYCDRLSFTELLHQFGIKDTEGQGSLNGRLPVAFGEGGLTFDDGFLFSTPGNSGIVHFGNTEQLRQGIGDTSQSATLDYSIQALENFAYNWTKLSFNSEGEDLLLAMQLDGKPASPLPFGYKNGQIVSTKKGTGLQHPLRLDMNFRLPLQQLFKYGKNIQSLMENM